MMMLMLIMMLMMALMVVAMALLLARTEQNSEGRSSEARRLVGELGFSELMVQGLRKKGEDESGGGGVPKPPSAQFSSFSKSWEPRALQLSQGQGCRFLKLSPGPGPPPSAPAGPSSEALRRSCSAHPEPHERSEHDPDPRR